MRDNFSGPRSTLVEPRVPVEEVRVPLGVAQDLVYRRIDTIGVHAHRIGNLRIFRLSEAGLWDRPPELTKRGWLMKNDTRFHRRTSGSETFFVGHLRGILLDKPVGTFSRAK